MEEVSMATSGELSMAKYDKWLFDLEAERFARLLDELREAHPDVMQALQRQWQASAAWCGTELLCAMLSGKNLVDAKSWLASRNTEVAANLDS